MNNLIKRSVRVALIYISCIPILIVLGFVHEHLAHAFLFLSSAVFAFRMIYEARKGFQRYADVKYPAQKRIPQLRTLENLAYTVEKAVSGQDRYYMSVKKRLRQILLDRVRPGLAHADVEELSDKSEELHGLVDDPELLKLLFSKETEKSGERLHTLNRILDKLED